MISRRDALPALVLALVVLWTGAARAEAAASVDPALRDALIKAVNSADSFANRYVAEVWLMDMSRRLEKRIQDPGARLELLRQVHFEASRVRLKPELVLAVIEVESGFNRWAVSSAGAQGLMQVMPFWLKEIGRPEDNLFEVATNLRMGCTILRYYLDMAKGDLTDALARYNGSYGRYEYPAQVYKALERRWYAQ